MLKIIKLFFEYILFLVFIIAFLLVLVLFDIIQRVFALFGRKGIELSHYLFNKSIMLSLKITGASFNYFYANKLEGPNIFLSNHQSMFDIPCLYVGAKHLAPRFVSKIELAKGIPGVSTCLKLSKSALIDRKDPNQALPEIKRFGQFIKSINKAGVIFPEGTRAKDGVIKPFKKKGSESLIKECLPCWVTPVCIDGSWNFQKNKRGPIPFGTKVSINYLTPMRINNESEIKDCLSICENLINEKLVEIRRMG